MALWPVALADTFAAAIAGGQRRTRDRAEVHAAVAVKFAASPPDLFFNVNTPSDLEAAAMAPDR